MLVILLMPASSGADLILSNENTRCCHSKRTAALSLSERGNKLGAPKFAKRGLYLVPLKVALGSLRVYIVMKV